jgi:hypothetical protein
MLYRVLPVFVLALTVAFLTGGAVLADDAKTHEGLVVNAADGKLTMTDKDGKNEHTHQVDADTKITCDGKECKLEDLKKGFAVKVTTEKKADKEKVTKIEAKKP